MAAYLRGTWKTFMRYRHLLMNLVSRDVKIKYRRSTLGLLWSVLNPLLMMLVMGLVFQNIFNPAGSGALEVVPRTGEPPKFLAYLISGQIIFSFFNDSTTNAMTSVLGNAALLKKVYIPKYIFPLEKVLFGLLNLGFSLVAMALVLLFTGSGFGWWGLLFWVPILLLFFFNLGVGLILSAGVVFFRDIQHLYSVLILALTYMTPIFYNENVLFPQGSLMWYVIRCNPLYWYVHMFRRLVLYGLPPTPYQWVAAVGFALVAMLAGLAIFRKTQDRFILFI